MLAGALFGALGGFLGDALGLRETLGIANLPVAMAWSALGGAAAGGVGARLWIAMADVVLLLLWWSVALTPAIEGPARRWVREDALPSGPVDAIVVLSSSVQADSSIDASGTERLLSAVDLLDTGVSHRLVTTRVVSRSRGRSVTSDTDQRRFVGMARRPVDWIVVGPVASTHDEALAAAGVLLPLGLGRVVVVTSPMHTRRACATFARAGFQVVCRAARERQHATRDPRTSGDRVAAFGAYLYEQMAMLLYTSRGWL